MRKRNLKLTDSKYRIHIYYDIDDYWIAEHPELHGCIADGNTPEEALASLAIARTLWIESRIATGNDIPSPRIG